MGFLDRFKKKEELVRRADTAAVVETVAKPKNLLPGAVQAGQILLHPLVTEKAAQGETRGTYAFVVARQATKEQIRRALLATYGVTPSAVRIVNVEGKRVMFGRVRGKRSDWKKALVTLPKGQIIRIHEGV